MNTKHTSLSSQSRMLLYNDYMVPTDPKPQQEQGMAVVSHRVQTGRSCLDISGWKTYSLFLNSTSYNANNLVLRTDSYATL